MTVPPKGNSFRGISADGVPTGHFFLCLLQRKVSLFEPRLVLHWPKVSAQEAAPFLARKVCPSLHRLIGGILDSGVVEVVMLFCGLQCLQPLPVFDFGI